jgi:hypothetical protein
MRDNQATDASVHHAIAAGSCVMIERGEMVYAGPLVDMPEAEGRLILLHPEDFGRLKYCWDGEEYTEQTGMLS